MHMSIFPSPYRTLLFNSSRGRSAPPSARPSLDCRVDQPIGITGWCGAMRCSSLALFCRHLVGPLSDVCYRTRQQEHVWLANKWCCETPTPVDALQWRLGPVKAPLTKCKGPSCWMSGGCADRGIGGRFCMMGLLILGRVLQANPLARAHEDAEPCWPRPGGVVGLGLPAVMCFVGRSFHVLMVRGPRPK